jgi:hypothetical protein
MTTSTEMLALADRIAAWTPEQRSVLVFIARERRMIEDALRTVALIDAIRADEGNTVTLICSNPDFNGQPNEAIKVSTFWKNDSGLWGDRRFAGDTVLDCLRTAHAAMTSSDAPATPVMWGGWQPIETAPEDKPVIICTDTGAVGEARYFVHHGWYWAGNDPSDAHDGAVRYAKLWQPLPEAPQ